MPCLALPCLALPCRLANPSVSNADALFAGEPFSFTPAVQPSSAGQPIAARLKPEYSTGDAVRAVRTLASFLAVHSGTTAGRSKG